MYLDRLEYKKDILLSLDGRCRFVSAAFLIAAAVYATSPAALLGVICACVLLSAREPRVTFSRLIPVNIMGAAVWLSALSGLSVRNAALYTLRINAAALLYMVFIIPMEPGAIAASMAKLGISKKLTALFVLTHRAIFLMSGHISTALTSMRLRSPGGGSLRQWRSFAAVFAAATAAAVLRSQRIAQAMVLRGFNGAFPMTRKFEWKARDTAALAICLAVSILVILKG